LGTVDFRARGEVGLIGSAAGEGKRKEGEGGGLFHVLWMSVEDDGACSRG
jgi:hypothetical protein